MFAVVLGRIAGSTTECNECYFHSHIPYKNFRNIPSASQMWDDELIIQTRGGLKKLPTSAQAVIMMLMMQLTRFNAGGTVRIILQLTYGVTAVVSNVYPTELHPAKYERNEIMRIGTVFNASLLAVIARKGEITYDELKKEYCEPTPSGVVSGRNVMFDSDLKVLESEGYISIKEGVITHIQR